MTSPELLREASIIDYLGGTPAGTMRTTTRSIWDDHLDSPLSLTSSSNWALAPRRVELLRDCVENADDAEGLPEALTHSNDHVWAAAGSPGNLVVVGWAGSGRGPRPPTRT